MVEIQRNLGSLLILPLVDKEKKKIILNDAQGQPITCNQTKVDYFNNYFVTAIRNLKSEIEICHNDNCNVLRTLSQSPNRFVLENISVQC